MRKKQKKLGEGKKHQQQISANLLETVLFRKKLQIFFSNKTTQKLEPRRRFEKCDRESKIQKTFKDLKSP